MALITVNDLSFSFNGKDPVLQNVWFELEENEKNILIGPNGSGKTVFIKCLLGVLKTEKKISIENVDVDLIRNFKDLSTNLSEILSIWENIKAKDYLESNLKLRSVQLDEAMKMISLFELDDILNKNVRKISSGQQRMLRNIVALAHEARITILDEPFSEIDPRRAAKLMNILNSRSGSVLITLHDLSMIRGLKNATLSIMSNRRIFGKIRPANKIFDMYISESEPEKFSICIKNGEKDIYLTDEMVEGSRPLRSAEDLFVFY